MKLLITWSIALIIGFYAGRRTPPTTPVPAFSSDKETPPAKNKSINSSASPDAAVPVKTDDPLQLEAELVRLIGQLRAGGNTSPIRQALDKLARLDLPRAVSLVKRHADAIMRCGFEHVIADALSSWASKHPDYARELLAEWPTEKVFAPLLAAAVKELSKKDAAAAWSFLQRDAARLDPSGQLAGAIASNWGAQHPSQAANFGVRIPDAIQRASFLRGALPHYLRMQPRQFAAWLQGRPDAEQLRSFIKLDSLALRDDDLQHGLELLQAVPVLFEDQETERKFFTQLWQQDKIREHAEQWINQLTDPVQRDTALGAFAAELAEKDRKRAESLLERISDPQTRANLTAQFIALDAKGDPDAAWAKASALPDGVARTQALTSVMAMRFSEDPIGALDFAQEHISELNDQAIISLSNELQFLPLIPELVNKCANLLMHASTPTARLEAMNQLVHDSDLRDHLPLSAMNAFANSFPEGAARETAIASLLSKADTWSPGMLQQALGLKDPVLREHALEASTRKWLHTDIEAAQGWLMSPAADVLSPDTLRVLRDEATGNAPLDPAGTCEELVSFRNHGLHVFY